MACSGFAGALTGTVQQGHGVAHRRRCVQRKPVVVRPMGCLGTRANGERRRVEAWRQRQGVVYGVQEKAVVEWDWEEGRGREAFYGLFRDLLTASVSHMDAKS